MDRTPDFYKKKMKNYLNGQNTPSNGNIHSKKTARLEFSRVMEDFFSND